MKKIYNSNWRYVPVVLWLLVSTGLMAAGVWSWTITWWNLGLLVLILTLSTPIEALKWFLITLPFMVVIQNFPIANFPMWRVLLVWLFVVVVSKIFIPQILAKNFVAFTKKYIVSNLAPWDLWLVVIFIFLLLSNVTAKFPVHGVKQVVYLLNAYLLYQVFILVKHTTQDIKMIKAVQSALLYSLLGTVALGYIQYALTFYSTPYYFWQYWATLVSSLYYGQSLGDVLAYSNSWFAAGAGGSSLRMFGIMQDTHSFAVIAMFALGLWVILKSKLPQVAENSWWKVLKSQSREFWLIFVGLCFAIVAAGTRGVWAAMLVPIVVAVFLWFWQKVLRPYLSFALFSYGVIVVLFLISPWISFGLNVLRTYNTNDDFLGRATSIYDLEESSNVGRIEIWQNSFKFALTEPFGTGYGNFITSVVKDIPNNASYEQISAEENYRYNLPQKFITAHSLYLHILVELGLLGVGVFLTLLYFLVKPWIKIFWQPVSQISRHYLLVVSIGLVLIWLLAYGLFDVTILNERVLLYLMGLLAMLNWAFISQKSGDILKNEYE
ncbi:MAG: O-antigen ligase family protein [Candidatus Doudnabacteria bacterium]